MKPRAPTLHRPVILLVEDEFLVRTTQVDILREAGFWIVEAEDADEAFELLKRRQDIKLVLTDVDMPGSLDGFEFARLVAQGWPEVGVLVISGKTAPGPGAAAWRRRWRLSANRPAALVQQIREIMDRIGVDQSAPR
jgi:two-component system, response regulator PdtaR